jgi:hypothetical protein
MCNFALTRKFRAIVFPSGWDSYKFLSGIIRDSGPAASVAGLEFVGGLTEGNAVSGRAEIPALPVTLPMPYPVALRALRRPPV